MRSAETRSAVAVSSGERILAAILLALGVAMFAIGFYLTPAPSGCGTHTQLHLAPCAFKTFSGRGEVIAAFDAHPFGIILFGIVLFMAILGAKALVLNRPISPTLGRYFNNKILAVLGIAFIATWLFNLFRCL